MGSWAQPLHKLARTEVTTGACVRTASTTGACALPVHELARAAVGCGHSREWECVESLHRVRVDLVGVAASRGVVKLVLPARPCTMLMGWQGNGVTG